MFTVANCETFYMGNRSTYTTKRNAQPEINLNRFSDLIINESQELSQYALGDLCQGHFGI